VDSDASHPHRWPLVTLVVAMADNAIIGRDGALPWHLPDDLRRFKAFTLGKPVLMGRKTWNSLGRPLPGRTNVVMTRTPAELGSAASQGAVVVSSLAQALTRFAASPEIAVIGGAEIYALSLPAAGRIERTRVHADIEGDTAFPALTAREWRVVASEAHPADARHPWPMTFETLQRVVPADHL
jgi:dihydrofolate reductase